MKSQDELLYEYYRLGFFKIAIEINIVTNKGRWKTHQIFKEFDKILLKMGIKREELTILFSENLF